VRGVSGDGSLRFLVSRGETFVSVVERAESFRDLFRRGKEGVRERLTFREGGLSSRKMCEGSEIASTGYETYLLLLVAHPEAVRVDLRREGMKSDEEV
jgi:hypothetical protein